MGVNNRQRRKAKKQQERQERQARMQRAGQPYRAVPPPPERLGRPRPDPTQAARDAVLGASEAFRRGPEEVYADRLDSLVDFGDRHGQAAIRGAVAWWVEQGLDRAWHTGWQPADVMRTVRRRLGPRHAEAVATAVAASAGRRPEATADDRWGAQVAAISHEAAAGDRRAAAGAQTHAIEALSVLLRLPPVPKLAASAPRAGRAAGRGAGAMLERVRALLAKAESTTFPEEAEALSAKAQELMARHAIDAAMLDAADPGGGGGTVVGWRIGVDDPYADAKSLLLDRIARANRCSAVWCKPLGSSTVFGARSDLEMVELLFTSLLVQATEAILRSGRSVDRSGRSRTTSFRKSFLVAYAIRIGERLAAATASVVAEGTERHGDALLPVLAGRAEAVEEAVQQTFPDTVSRGPAVTNHAGWVAGRAAADLASLRAGEELATG